MSVRLTAGVASALWAGAAALALHERHRAPRPDAEPPARPGPLVSVIVPARNEERGVGAAIASLRALDYSNVQLLVVDDQSTDGTLAAARAAAGDDARVRVIAGEVLPDGWVGKSWACWQGVRAALTAIGTFLAPGPLARSDRSRVAIAAVT